MADLGKQGTPKAVPEAAFAENDLSKLTKSELEQAAAGVLQGLFYMIAGAIKQPHWQITEKEAVELAKAVLGCVKSLPSKQSKKIDKFLKENAPYIKLLMVSGGIFIGRISYSVQIAQLKKENDELRRNSTIAGDPIAAAAAGAGTGGVHSDDFIQ